MKKIIGAILLICLLFSGSNAFCQRADSTFLNQFKNIYVSKGTTFLSGGLSLLSADKVTQTTRLYGLEVGAGYYVVKGFALKALFVGQHLDVANTNISPFKELDKVNIWQVSGQGRYNLYVKSNEGSVFIQSGYRYGKLPEHFKRNLQCWEILSLGATGNSSRSREARLGIEARVGVEKSSLSKPLLFSMYVGINYYIRSEGLKTRRLGFF